MGYTIWDREIGGPYKSKIYQAKKAAQAFVTKLNSEYGETRWYVKEL